RSIGNVPLGEECLAQWVDFSRPLPPLPLMELQDSLEFFAEYDFTIEDKAWRSKMVQWNEQDTVSRLEVMCWLLNDTYDGNLWAGKAGDIHEWALAFDVGSSGKNVVSVTNFLLTKMKASHPHAPDDEDTDDSPFVLIYPDVIVID
ncbi:hypothetical protein K504DRAFT_459430, partial [Pleomassaria siparia CBS 279.74]